MLSYWGSMIFQKARTYTPSHKVSYPRRLESSTKPLWKPQIPTASWLNAGWFRRKVSSFAGDNIGRCERKLHMDTCLNLNVYREIALWISRPKSVRFFFCGVGLRAKFTKERWIQRRIARSHIGCCCPHKETWRSTQTNNTRSSHTSCELHWGWRWDFRTFTVNCNISVLQICHLNIILTFK
jgi:hypothetical protein